MTEPTSTVTVVEEELARRRRWSTPILFAVLAVFVLGLAVLVAGILGLRMYFSNDTRYYPDPVEHFKYGSIGAEENSGIPYKVWMTLPKLFPDAFEGRDDYSAFGFLYEQEDGKQRDLPIGISKRNVHGVDVVWFNCAVCHVGTWQSTADGPKEIVLGMPSNNLQLHRFIEFVLSLAADEKLQPSRLFDAMDDAGYGLGPIETLVWQFVVMPRMREGLIARQSHLAPLLDVQPAWGPGRVDTFNPYKVGNMGLHLADLTQEERIGTTDFPSIFLQGPREGMHLHWDGNNTSLAERNLSAALGAGVTPETVDHEAIERVADWLKTFKPPPSPHVVDAAAAARGKQIYASECAACHGFEDGETYRFEGAQLGQVDPIGSIGTDRARLDSYTENFRQMQLSELFAGTPYQFKNFTKTDGYANMPLDGLWLRGPYLHNGSVPTLADLLKQPSERPTAFTRDSDVIDDAQGGFVSPSCTPSEGRQPAFCYGTRLPGNGNGGHLYGTWLPANEKSDLLAYLLTF
ncbi:c-type cytochrome [Rhizobium sp. BK251]|uniref:c-type cytochrome n=1 Tax=Rhizobium sp. BK251 TaxID=2512125 RepID=UPI00104F25D4|nr:c-type cytochrome [Rhizobium sp. BK251]TCL75691.1 cytochrome c [Rhizobium sp. BK251]